VDLSAHRVAAGGEDGRVDAAPDAEPAVVGEERGGGWRCSAQEDPHHLLRHQRAVHEDAVMPVGRHGRRRRHEESSSRGQDGAGQEEDDGDRWSFSFLFFLRTRDRWRWNGECWTGRQAD
jgi:hypothetical protein